jgi:hypothetical protein
LNGTDTDAWDPQDYTDLQTAVGLLERTPFIARLTHFAGQPIERMLATLPPPVAAGVHNAVRATVTRLLGLALKTMDGGAHPQPSRRFHKMA